MIYLDYAATTPLDPLVLQAMLPHLAADDGFANPASSHAAGFKARAAVDAARAQVAALLGAEPAEIVWTSGATESNNLAIKGALEFHGGRGAQKAHIVTSRTEHKCVLDTCRHLETQGVRVSFLKPATDGLVSPEQVLEALTPDTVLVSLMWVNNEIGVVQDVQRLAPLLRERGVLFHVDAVQAAGKLPIDLRAVPIDLLSVSAHKIYGPKGVGALFVRKRPRARLAPQMHGGGHEWGMRSGTLATHQVVGMGAAFELAAARLHDDAARLAGLRDLLWQRLSGLPRILRNGDPQRGASHLLNLSFEGVEGEALRAALPELAVSSGSACSSATQEPSYVLRALGRDDELANASLRFSLGRDTRAGQIETAAAMVIEQVQRLRELSPLWAASGAASLGPATASRQTRGEMSESGSNPFGYSAPILRLFQETPRAGEFAAGTPGVVTAEAGSKAAHSVLRLQLLFEAGKVADARFKAYGCPSSIAVGAWIAGWSLGRTRVELAALRAADLRQALEIADDRAHCALLGEDAIRAALAGNSTTN